MAVVATATGHEHGGDAPVDDLAFYNVELQGQGVKGRATTFARRVLRRLLLPFFTRKVEILTVLSRRIAEGDKTANIALTRTELLNLKLDRLNQKLEALLLKLEALKGRQDDLHKEVAVVVALNWDHTAIVRRLGQLEDRMIGIYSASAVAHEELGVDVGPSIRFPGLELFDKNIEPDDDEAEEPGGLPEEPQSQVG